MTEMAGALTRLLARTPWVPTLAPGLATARCLVTTLPRPPAQAPTTFSKATQKSGRAKTGVLTYGRNKGNFGYEHKA